MSLDRPADGRWAALFSGGKDSYLALREARERGLGVDRLVCVDAPPHAYLYHGPGTAAVPAIADALDLPLERLRLRTRGSGGSAEAAAHELAPLRAWLSGPDAEGIDGLVSGVVASRYQRDLLTELCDAHDLGLYTPLWGKDGEAILDAVTAADLAVDVVAVAADGLDRAWLGRRLSAATIAELRRLASRHGIHPAGEGGEYETLVVDAPAFARPVRYRATVAWDGTAGHLDISAVASGG